jgi:hypothetical protein
VFLLDRPAADERPRPDANSEGSHS